MNSKLGNGGIEVDEILGQSESARLALCDSACRSGQGFLHVGRVGELSCIASARASSPLKLFIPPRQRKVPHVYLSSFGGGMLAGDVTHLKAQIDEGAECIISSQASTKIYRNPEKLPCSQSIDATIASGATLVVAPEAISPFADSLYMQTQRFDIAAGGNLVMCDWLSSGRYETGERFKFDLYQSRQSIYYDGHHVLEDAIRLDSTADALDSPFCMGHYNCLGLFAVVGDRFQSFIDAMLQWEQQAPHGADDTLVVAQAIRQGLLIRVVSTQTQPVRLLFENWFKQIDAILGASVWVGKQ